MRVPDYQPRVSGSVERLAPRISAEAVGGGAEGLAQIGKDFDAVAEKFAQNERRSQALDVTRRLAEEQEALALDLKSRTEAAEPGAPDFTGRFKADLEARRSAFLEATPESVRAYAEARWASMGGALTGHAATYEGAARAAKRQTDHDQAVAALANGVRTNPDLLETTLGSAAALAAALTPTEQMAKGGAAKDAILKSYYQGLNDRDPATALAQLTAGEFDAGMKPGTKDQLVNEAQGEIRRRDAEARAREREARAELRVRVDDELKNGLTEIQYYGKTDLISEDRVRAAYGEVAPKVLAGIQEAKDFYVVTQDLGLATPAEVSERLAAMLPRGERAAAQAQYFEAAQKFVQSREKALLDDPASYVLSVSKSVAGAFAKAEETGAEQDWSLAASAMAETQARLGVRPEKIAILGKGRAERLVQSIAFADPEEAWKGLAELGRRYGASAPAVFRELVKAGLKQEYLPLATTENPVAAKTYAEVLKNEQARHGSTRQAVGEKAKEIDGAVTDALASFRQSLALAPNATALGSTYQGAAQLLAYRYAMSGQSSSEAAKKAVTDLVDGKYEYLTGSTVLDGTRLNGRVPKRFNADAVTGEAERAIALLAPDELMAPRGVGLTPEQAQGEYLRQVRRGQWVTNADETGLMLVDPLGQPVMRVDGTAVQVAFEGARPMSTTERMLYRKARGAAQMQQRAVSIVPRTPGEAGLLDTITARLRLSYEIESRVQNPWGIMADTLGNMAVWLYRQGLPPSALPDETFTPDEKRRIEEKIDRIRKGGK